MICSLPEISKQSEVNKNNLKNNKNKRKLTKKTSKPIIDQSQLKELMSKIGDLYSKKIPNAYDYVNILLS